MLLQFVDVLDSLAKPDRRCSNPACVIWKAWVAALHDTRRFPNSGHGSLTNAVRFTIDYLFKSRSFLSKRTHIDDKPLQIGFS
jgi:hypothetical protein